MGAWRRSATEAAVGSTTCQVSRFFQSRETTATRLRTSSGSLFQSPRGPWRSLLIRTGARPLARNSSAKLVATTGFSVTPRQKPAEPVLGVDELLGAVAIPVVLAEEADAGEPAGPLQAVEVVVLPLLADGEVLADAEVGCASQSIPRWRLGLTPPWPQLWIAAPWRDSCPWNRFEPVMIRLEIPAQVMLEVDSWSSAW